MWGPTSITGKPGDRRDDFREMLQVPRKESGNSFSANEYAVAKFSRNLRRSIQQQSAKHVGNFYGEPIPKPCQFEIGGNVGTHHQQGTARKQYEDANIMGNIHTKGSKSVAVCAVFDGHNGVKVARYLEQNFLKVLASEFAQRSMDVPANVLQGFRATFDRLNTAVKHVTAGSTAVTAAITDRYIIIANVGDTRAVLIREDEPIQLTFDQKPEHPDIKRLIMKDRAGKPGGFVSEPVTDEDVPRLNGLLSTGRAIGDTYIGNVSHKPKISAIPRCINDKYLILACDGFWENMGAYSLFNQIKLAEESVDQIGGYKDQKTRLEKISQFLSEVAVRWGSTDDITVSIVDLRQSST